MHKSVVLLTLCIISFIARLNAQYSVDRTLFEETLSTTAASQIDFQIINKLPGSVVWSSGNSTDVVSIRATISGPTEEDTIFVFIDVNYTPNEKIRVLIDLNSTSNVPLATNAPTNDIITNRPRPRRETLVSSALRLDALLQVFAAFTISLFRKRSTTLLALSVVVLCAALSTAEVDQTAQVRVQVVVIVPRDHYWQSVFIETKDSNVSMIDVNTLNKTCGLSDSSSTCPFCCSSNGVCTLSGCACTAGYSAADCSVGECIPTNCPNGTCPEVDSPCGCSGQGVCSLGTVKCQNNELKCVGAIFPASSIDSCGVDSNCDGELTSQPDILNDTEHCGACNKRCADLNANALWSCASGECVFEGCKTGYYDLTGNQSCSYTCQFTSPYELCNGLDDDCDGQVDENTVPVDLKRICGVSPAATTSECTSQVSAQCVSGQWECSFPANVCNPTCASAVEICDNLDNNCNGVLNENVPQLGLPCASDDASTVSHGACRTTGTYVCNGPNNVTCSAVKASCATLPGGCTELCDGIDNDCDGLTDETFAQKGTAVATFVRPTVTSLSGSLWMSSYEISRASSTASSFGSGTGWRTNNSDSVIDATRGCSADLRLPWTQISPLEAADVCTGMGGRLCTLTEWRTACWSSITCVYGYSPATTAACTQPADTTRYCNIVGSPGTQFTIIPTATLSTSSCGADWTHVAANTGNATRVWDLTGNLFEIVTNGAAYAMVGGSFKTSERGTQCRVSQVITSTQRFSDLGFRCCFDSNPTL